MLTFSTDCNIDYALPIVSGDVVKFIVPTSIAFSLGDDLSTIEIGLGNCDEVIFPNIGTIEQVGDSLYCTVTIPEITDCDYRILFYSILDPVDCGLFEGFTLGEVIAEGVKLGQVINCTLEDFIL